MRLFRFLLVKFSALPEDLSILNKQYGDVTLTVSELTDFNIAQNMILVQASIKILQYPVTHDLLLDVPDHIRRECEEVIEKVTRVLAVCYGVRREIFSPSGFSVGYLAENEYELKLLTSVKGGAFNHAKLIFLRAVPLTNFNWEEVFSDREEGVLLMAEAFNQTSCSGQFRDFMRLFEHAFKMSTDQFSKKLSEFLNPIFGYTRAEIISWYKIRHPLSHADQKKTQTILYEADVAPIIDRVTQAAYDVLLNKAEWNNSSTARRKVWSPGRYSTNEAGEGAMTAGETRINYKVTDPYNVYQSIGVDIKLDDGNFIFFAPKKA